VADSKSSASSDKAKGTGGSRSSSSSSSSRGRSSRQSASKTSATDVVAAAPVQDNSSGSGKLLGILALIISLIALFLGGFSGYQAGFAGKLATEKQSLQVGAVGEKLDGLSNTQTQLSEQYNKLKGDLDDQVSKLKGNVEEQYSKLRGEVEGSQAKFNDLIDNAQTSLAGQIEADKSTRAQELDGFRGEFNELSTSVSKVYQDLGRSVDTWAVEEVENLLSLANQRLQLAGDVDVAATALGLADARLAEIGDPGFTNVRAAIADEINALNAVETVDVPGLALNLASMSGSVDALPLPAPKPEIQTPAAAGGDATQQTANGSKTDRLKAMAKTVLKDMGSMVKVKNVDETRKPSLPVEQEYFIYENLRLLLNSAQLALLRGAGGTYKQNLDTADTWVGDHFDTEADAVKDFSGKIGELSGVTITPALPDISNSLNELRKILQARSGSAS